MSENKLLKGKPRSYHSDDSTIALRSSATSYNLRDFVWVDYKECQQMFFLTPGFPVVDIDFVSEEFKIIPASRIGMNKYERMVAFLEDCKVMKSVISRMKTRQMGRQRF